nr:hypothetical protein Iba_scaffold19770CG0010 [Ipomoea batatas]
MGGGFPGEQFQEQNPETINIRFLGDLPRIGYLGGPVPIHPGGSGGRANKLGKTEIGDPGIVGFVSPERNQIGMVHLPHLFNLLSELLFRHGDVPETLYHQCDSGVKNGLIGSSESALSQNLSRGFQKIKRRSAQRIPLKRTLGLSRELFRNLARQKIAGNIELDQSGHIHVRNFPGKLILLQVQRRQPRQIVHRRRNRPGEVIVGKIEANEVGQ